MANTDDNPLSHEDPPPTSEESPALGEQFLLYLEHSKFDRKQYFLPEGHLERLITREALKDDLFFDKLSLSTADEHLIEFITTSAKRVFATAYCALGSGGSPLLATMKFFQTIDFSDKVLSFEDHQTGEPPRNAQTQPQFPFNRIRDARLRRHWPAMRIHNFFNTRWMFLAPVFTTGRFHHILSPNVVLPFVWVNHVTKGGRFSKVYEVEIHPSHQKLLGAKIDGTPAHVAIKEILTTEDDDDLKQEIEANFNLEANALSDISSLEHNHIIERLAAITIDGRHYFMFEWADGGNLREFWKEHALPDLTPQLVRQSVVQLCGLADALANLHDYNEKAHYRHGDLKPENILRFKDGTFVGTLKIADMGLAKRHTEATDARLVATSTKYGTTRYEPPEATTNRLNARSRLYDVWSLGCITLEYIIWLLYGQDGVQQFTNDVINGTGCFYLIENGGDQKKAVVHPTVVQWMDSISQHQECSTQTAIRNLLELVRDRLLVVALQTGQETNLHLSSAMFKLTPAESSEAPTIGPFRAKATKVSSALQKILDLGDENQSYLLANERQGGSRRQSAEAIPRSHGFLRPPSPSRSNTNDSRKIDQSYDSVSGFRG